MANLGNGDTASILETHDMQPEELNEGEIIKKKWGNWLWQKG